MKNLTYIPFIRNRYFKGKLLTAEDFLQEQQYMNDKRRLLNRWMLGAGIVAGLEVVRVDDYSISLEMGLALDYTGREIMVDTPVIKKLSLLDGYEDATREEGRETLYLCIEYDEGQIEPVHNVTNREVHTVEEPEYNKVREGYHLYVTDDEPGEKEEQDNGALPEDENKAIYERAENIQRRACEPGIHLAKIYLVKSGDFYMIHKVEPVPFHQYAYSAPILMRYVAGLRTCMTDQEKRLADADHRPAMDSEQPGTAGTRGEWQLAQGMVNIVMPDGGREGHCYYSQEIAHGLGIGNVQIHLEVIRGDYSFSGSEDIFDQQEKGVEAASRLSRAAGTFVIGIRALYYLKCSEVQVSWTALRRRDSNSIRKGEPRVYIKPGLVNLKVRQDVKLEAVCVNLSEPDLEWNTVGADGGMVETEGTYHAPGRPGVYEVQCRERATGAAASVFIVVRE